MDWEKPLLSEAAQDLAHFLAPTTTFWKTAGASGDSRAQSGGTGRAWMSERISAAVGALPQRLPLFLTVTCLRGVSWCAMALREYEEPGRTASLICRSPSRGRRLSQWENQSTSPSALRAGEDHPHHPRVQRGGGH